MQSDTSTWDAGDIRYNVLRWTSSPNPPFGGYGPSFVNPRTGEILGADIMLEWTYITNRIYQNKLFNEVDQILPIEEIADLLVINTGEYISKAKINQTTEIIKARLSMEGYAFARINAMPNKSLEKNEVDISFFIRNVFFCVRTLLYTIYILNQECADPCVYII